MVRNYLLQLLGPTLCTLFIYAYVDTPNCCLRGSEEPNIGLAWLVCYIFFVLSYIVSI